MALTPTSPSSSLPQPQSYEQILSTALSAYSAAIGVNDFNVGGVMLGFMQVAALMTARSSGDIFQILKDYSLDRAQGPALQNLAIEYGVTPIGSTVATGTVTVTDLSFTKIYTQIYAGQNPPLAGSTKIYVSDASKFTPSGQIYIGRGSVNIEGPLSYTSITPIGSYYYITLSSPTTKFHNISESVILAQGGVRTVPANTVVISPGVGTTPNIQFSVTQSANILDGETTVSNIPITSLLPGAINNVPAGSISQFSGNPSGLSNASVTNTAAITTGKDTETDEQLRVRVKNALASTGLGTVQAIQSALQGVQDPQSANTIVSTDVLNSPSNTIVYVDNGSGYEATHQGVPIETIVNSALGGEQYFQLVTGGTQTSVTKAFLQSVQASPFDLNGGEVLTVVVGDLTYNHSFQTSDFANPGSATAYEICASINADTSLNYEAVTSENGLYVVIRPKDETTNSIQVTIPSSSFLVNANSYLQFPSQKAETLRLYKNGILLSEDGNTATIITQPQSFWSDTLASGETLSLSIDGTAPITFTLTDAMFVAEGTYTTLAYSNSLESWVNVLNNNITGITASIVGSTIEITSNLGSIDRAEITVINTISNPTSLIAKGFISSTNLSSLGKQSDYILNRNTAQIKLTVALKAGDSLTAGYLVTQANIKAGSVSSGTASLSTDGHVWISIDSNTLIIPTIKTGSYLSVSTVGSNTIRYTSSSLSAFSNVLPGDYVIVWSPELVSGNQLEGRVHAQTGSTLDIKITAAEYALASAQSGILYIQGFVVVRTKNPPQKFKVAAGTYTLYEVQSILQSQTDQLTFSVFQDNNIVVVTNTVDSSGEIVVVTSDASAQLLGFTGNVSSVSQDPLVAFYQTQSVSSELPLFFHSQISADVYASPIDSYVTSFSSANSLSSFDPNQAVKFLNPYGGIDDEQPENESVQISSISGSSVSILPEYPNVRRLRTNDRFYVANPLDFGYNDTVVSIVDNNTVGETYTMPLYRRAITNTTDSINSFNFNAYDVDTGTASSFTSNFSGFDFSNFKALMQAKRVVQGTNAQTALLYRSTLWGRSGEKINVSYVYPTAANQAINSNVTVNDTINIQIHLISGTAISSTIGASTQWNVTVASNTPSAGIDQLTFTYTGTGTAPNLTLSGGEYVNISSATNFNNNNTGIFKISTATGYLPNATKFSVQIPTGTGFAQSGVTTGVLNGIQFYQSSPTTASAINTYVNTNLSNYVTSTIVDDGGTSGSGNINLSTYENSGFTVQSYFLKDGINWIANSNVASTPQFTFKNALSYPSDTGYAFNNGDEIRLVPTNIDQVDRLWNVLAVTGFTTVGSIVNSDRGTKIQLSTNTLGSNGSIQIVGGSGNQYSVPVINSGELVSNTTMISAVDSISGQSIASDQWFRLQANSAQNKNTGIFNNTNVTVQNNTPSLGQSTVTLTNQSQTQLYFGAPRSYISVSGSTFRIEKQGSLACMSWTGAGTTPVLSSLLNFNDTAGWTVNVGLNGVYAVASGAANFSALSIGDLITISGCSNLVNNGTFFVTGVASNGLSFTTSNSLSFTETGTAIAFGQFSCTSSVSEGDTVIISAPFSPLNQGTYRVIRMNNNSIWYENADVYEEEQNLTSSTLKFYQYEATIPGDLFVVGGNSLGTGNAGTYKILSITNPTTIVVSGSITSQTNTSLSLTYTGVNVVEGIPYTGYKQVLLSAPRPGSTNSNSVIFNTSNQYEKINASAGVELTSLSKLNFPTTVRAGLDCYNYDTGLIGEANQVLYGNPRDTVTYPGVIAAGTDIYIREPLLKRIKISVAIRTNIGVSFPQITSQIQSTVYSLVLANPLGQSLDISQIVESVRLIPGITSVVITSPTYNINNDEITLVTGEKAFIVSQQSDINVSLIGS